MKMTSNEWVWSFDHWKTFSKNYKSIRQCFLFVYKSAKSNCCSQVFADFIQTQSYSTFLNKISILTICHIKLRIFFFSTIFLGIIYNRKTYFINYKLQKTNKPTNKQNLLPPTLTVPLVTENHLLLPTPPSWFYPPPPDSNAELNQIKCQKVLIFKTFSTCCHFLLYIVCFFSLFIEIFCSMFLTFMISLIKNFIINYLHLLEL